MDESRIRQLTEEVLSQIRSPSADLESRVAALEEAVSGLQRSETTESTLAVSVSERHVPFSLRMLGVPSGASEGRCCFEPDKPCVQSGQCRTLGH